MNRDIENLLDAFAEAAISTHGAVSVTDVTLRVSDSLMDAVVAYCQLPTPTHVTRKGAAWRQTAGKFRGLTLVLVTEAKRYMGAA